MNIIIHTKNIEPTPALKAFINDKVGTLGKFFGKIKGQTAQARVEVSRPSQHHRSGAIYYAEINIEINNKFFRAVAEHFDIYAAIDKTRDEMEKQIRKSKEMLHDKRRRLGKKTA